MTKNDIIKEVADRTKQTDVFTKIMVQKTLDVIKDALRKEERIELRGFGVFKVKTRKPRMGRNPRTGEDFPVPLRKVVVFKPGLEMKVSVKNAEI